MAGTGVFGEKVFRCQVSGVSTHASNSLLKPDTRHLKPKKGNMSEKKSNSNMNLLDKAILALAPTYGAKRVIMRRRFERLQEFKGVTNRRSFDAVSGDRTRYDFLTSSSSADSAIKNDLGSLRQHVRQLEYNNGFVSGPIRRLVNNVVGGGIRFQARLTADGDNRYFPKINQKTAENFNRDMERFFRWWVPMADLRLMQDFYELQAVVAGAIERDNEALAILRISDRASRRRVSPLCVEVLEIDRLMTPMSEISNPAIRSGVEYDDEGVPKTYYILKVHPGETLTLALNRSDYDEVPAFLPNGTRKVLHLFRPVRPEQTRGYTQWASALKDIQDLDRYREAEIMGALEDACMTGTVETENPVGFAAGFTDPSGSDTSGYDRIHDFAPNQVFYLKPGEKFNIHRNNRPNEQFRDFSEDLMSGPSNAVDIPPEVFYQNFKGMNYSNARTVLLMFYLSCRMRQQFIIRHFCTPVYEALARDFIAKGKVPANGFDRREYDFLRHAWIPPGWQWVDPVKEAKGKEIDVENVFETLSDVHAARGSDYEEVMERRARELKFQAELEEKYGIKFPAKKAAAAPAADEDEDDEDEDGQPDKKGLRIVQP